MDPLALLLANPEEQEHSDPEIKEKKKKKISLAALKKQQAKAAEEARQLMIKYKKEHLNETKIRVQAEWEMNHAKALVYESEFEQNHALLKESFKKLAEIEEAWKEYLQEKRKQDEWMQYVTCNGLPNPSCISELNSYVFVWTQIDNNCQMSHCIKKTEEVMELLRSLEEIINNPGPGRPSYYLKDLKELRTELRNLLQKHIDRATFCMFSRIENDMESINVTTSKYFAKCKYFEMSLWAELITPIASSTGKEVRQPLKVTFDEVNVTLIVPTTLLDIHKVMRSMWLYYDHWSDQCRTFDCPSIPSYYEKSAYELFLEEFDQKKDIMQEREHLESVTKKKIAAIPAGPTLSQEIFAWESKPQKALSDEILFREFEEEDNLGWQVEAILDEFEVNLRARTFLGRLLLVEVLHQPPQAQCFRLKHCITLREEPPNLKPVDFYVKYPPKEDPEEGQEEEEEAEKVEFRSNLHTAADQTHTKEEEARKNLVVIRLYLSDAVVWFEEPQLAQWDPIHRYWSKENIHEEEFNEEDGSMTFKAGRLGLLGLHVSRYVHFPYEDWLFEPHKEGGVYFYLKTSKSDFHFRIKAGKVCLESMENVPSKAMDWVLGNYYPPAKLKEHLQKGGIDVFPSPDANSYVENVQSKHVVIERNIYQVWGLFSKTFRFKRSKFNQEVSRGNIVFQAQEVYEDHQVDFCLIQTAMCSCYVLNINEESEQYSSQKAPHMESCVDLYSLLHKNCTENAKRMERATCYLLIQTVQEFLGYVRPISFS